MLSSSFRNVEWLTQITGWQFHPKKWVQSVYSAHTEGQCHLKYGSSVDNSIPSPNSQSSQLQKAAYISQAETSSVSFLSSCCTGRNFYILLLELYCCHLLFFFHMVSLSIVSFEVGIEKLCHCALPGCLDESLMQKPCSFSRVLSTTACTNPLFLTEGQTNNLLQSECYKMSTFRIYNGL